jgi:hypothetical protein
MAHYFYVDNSFGFYFRALNIRKKTDIPNFSHKIFTKMFHFHCARRKSNRFALVPAD